MLFSEVEEVDYRSMAQLPQEGGFSPWGNINPKSLELLRATSAIATSFFMLPVDRIVAKKIVGQKINRDTLREIAKNPFLGATPRISSAFLSSFLTFGGSAVLQERFEQKYPTTPLVATALALAGGSAIDRLITSPLGTVVVRMQTQNKTFSKVIHEAVESKSPSRSLYRGTPALFIRDVLYLPVCIPLAEKFKSLFPSSSSPFIEFFRSTVSYIVSGTMASSICYSFQVIGLIQKDSAVSISMKEVFQKIVRENGLRGMYRGFGFSTLRLALYNCFFGGGIALGELLTKRF
jgi:hypothetical protein